MELETINKLYLELSQAATAATATELKLMEALETALDCAYWKGTQGIGLSKNPFEVLK